MDVWSSDGNLILGWNEIRVNQTQKEELKRHRFEVSDWITNLQSLIELDMRQGILASQQNKANFFSSYHTYAEITKYMNQLSGNHSSLVHYIPSIGVSIEKRDIPAFQIYDDTNIKQRDTIFLMG